MSQFVVLKPRMSEKAYNLSTEQNVYVFEVPIKENKHTISEAVTTQFKVTVTKVNIIKSKGKEKRTFMGGSRFEKGYRSDVKKAYVTLKEGDSITVYPEENTEEAPKKAKEAKK